jgi:hypothetical protein
MYLKVVYRCCVEECHSKVPHNGVMCKECFEKYLDDYYYAKICSKCNAVIDFVRSENSIDTAKRLVYQLCSMCAAVEKDPNIIKEREEDDEENFY